MSVYKKTDDENVIERLLNEHARLKTENFCNEDVGKSAKESNVLRVKGNEEFENENYKKALRLFNKSISKAPIDKCHKLWESQNSGLAGQEVENEFFALQLAIGDRSALLFELKKYDLCLKDIDYVLQMSCPPKLQVKLQLIRMECLEALSTSKEEVSQVLVQTNLEESPLTDNVHNEKEEETESEILFQEQKLNSLLENRDEDETPKDEKKDDQNVKSSIEIVPELPKISYNLNSIIPGFSDCIEIKETKEMGRGIFATQDIDTGAVLGIEKPFCASLDQCYHYTHCYHCFKFCYTLLPCLECSLVMFCSVECRESAWNSYHDVDCRIMPYYSKTKKDDILLCVLRLVLVAARKHKSLQDFYIAVKSFEENGKEFNADGKYDPTDYRTVYFLETNRSKRKPDQLEELATVAVKMLNYLETTTSFFSEYSVENRQESDESVVTENANCQLSLTTLKVFIGGLLFRHLQTILHVVGFYVLHYNLKIEEVSFGSGMYPLVSLINHSCDPNATRQTFNGNEQVLRASRPIHKGEQIFLCYGFNYLHDKYVRLYLATRYFFSCDCPVCVMHNPYNPYYDSDEETYVDPVCPSESDLVEESYVDPYFKYGHERFVYFKCQNCGKGLENCKEFSDNEKFVGLKTTCDHCNVGNNIEKLAEKVREALEMLNKITESEPVTADLIFNSVTTINNFLKRPSKYHAQSDKIMWRYFQTEAYDAGYSSYYCFDTSYNEVDSCLIS